MSTRLKRYFKFVFDMNRGEFLKVFFLTVAFFLIIGSYTVTKELKDAVFTSIVGSERKYFGYAKLLSMLFLVPIIFLHSRLVDSLRRHQLLYIYTTFFGVFGLLFGFLLYHPTIGLPNTLANPYRIFGWLFYFFVDSFSPLVVGVFWSFVNSVTEPSVSARNFAIMIAGSKIGGVLTSGLAWFLLSRNYFGTDGRALMIVLLSASLLLLLTPICIYFLTKQVPKKDLHGYEAVYQVEKQRKHEDKVDKKAESWISGMLSGIVLLFRYPYVMGIFGVGFFFELVNQALKVENLVFGKNVSNNVSELTSFLMRQALLVHVVGFIVVVFGTRIVLETFGEKKSLMLVPILTAMVVIPFIMYPCYQTALLAFVVTRSVNYAFAVPLRESLYIPTIKEIKFKTKSWIEGIGNKFAKMSASSYNIYVDGLIGSSLLGTQIVFFSSSIILWIITAYLLGRRFERCVERNEVIGSSE